MSISSVTGVSSGETMFRPQQNDAALKKEQLQKQLQQIEENKTLPQDEKERRMANIEKQIARLEQGKESGKPSSAASEKAGDTFEPQVPQQTAGVYQISRDEAGRPRIITDENRQTAQSRAGATPEEQGEKPIIVKTTGNTDQVDREIEQLKQTQKQMEQQIAATKDEKEKQALQTKLEQVKAELKMKDNDTYRRQHMQITEQKVVSRIGE